MSPPEDRPDSPLTKYSRSYSENHYLRAIVQAIPEVGGAIDTILSVKGVEYQKRRLESFLQELSERLEQLELRVQILPEDEEPFYDFIITTLEGVTRTRSQKKRSRLAALVTHQLQEKRSWDEAEVATDLLISLREPHIEILHEALNAPICGSPFEGLRVVTLSNAPFGEDGETKPLQLKEKLGGYSISAIRLFCSELVSRSLLHDEGVGRLNAKAMDYFVPTDLAEWFINWLGSE